MEYLNRTSRNRATRMKIGETIIKLLDHNSITDIKISAIAEGAGISRMTFYHYYETKEAALVDYLSEIILSYVGELKGKGAEFGKNSVEHLEFTLQFFAKHGAFLLKMEKVGCYGILMDGVNQFLDTNYKDEFSNSIYSLYFYAGALLNVFMKWIRGGKKESASEIADMLTRNCGGIIRG